MIIKIDLEENDCSMRPLNMGKTFADIVKEPSLEIREVLAVQGVMECSSQYGETDMTVAEFREYCNRMQNEITQIVRELMERADRMEPIDLRREGFEAGREEGYAQAKANATKGLARPEPDEYCMMDCPFMHHQHDGIWCIKYSPDSPNIQYMELAEGNTRIKKHKDCEVTIDSFDMTEEENE